jgi:[CysO sulfur-carrier protein]-S-L-cysteine hydrolase
MRMVVPERICRAIVQHALDLYPNQACGLVLFDADNVAQDVEPAVNMGAWPYGFKISPMSQYSAFTKSRTTGLEVSGVYHTHLVSAAVPTGRDLERPVPKNYLYLIVSLLDVQAPELRGYRVFDDQYHEIDLETGSVLSAPVERS